MTQTDFVGHTDNDLLYLIAEKAGSEIQANGDPGFIKAIGGTITIMECLKAVHDINPMRLNDMLEGRPTDRIHDVLGCLQHYDWASNQLTQCFSPRYTK